MRFAFIVSLLLVPLTFGQANGVVTGVVINGRASTPLAGVTVRLVPFSSVTEEMRLSAVTGSDGRFSIQGPAGQYRVFMDRSGFLPSSGDRDRLISVHAQQSLPSLVLTMVPAASVSGRVYGSDQKPVAGASIEVFQIAYKMGRRLLSPVARGPAPTLTDQQGQYRMSGLAPGTYYVRFQTQAVIDGRKMVAHSLFYPEAADPRYAAPITLLEGSEAWADFRIPSAPRDPGITISGHIVVESPMEIGKVKVSSLALLPRDPGALSVNYLLPFTNRLKSEEGRFEIAGIQPGSYDLFASVSNEAGEPHLYGPTPITVRYENLDSVAIPVPALIESLRGGLVVHGNPASIDVSQLEIELSRDYAPGGDATGLDTDGNFEFERLVPGRYRVRVLGLPPDAMVEDVLQGGRSTFDAGTVLVENNPEPIRVVVSPAGGVIQGTVTKRLDNQPLAGATVVLVPSAPRRRALTLYKSVTTTPDGSFVLRGIAPGSYRLFAWEKVAPGAYENEEFLAQYETQGQVINIGTDSRVNAVLKVLPATE